MKTRNSTIQKILQNFKGKGKQTKQENDSSRSKKPYSKKLKDNEKWLREKLGESQDVVFTSFKIKDAEGKAVKALLIAIDGLVDEEAKRDHILKPLIEPPQRDHPIKHIEQIKEHISAMEVTIENDLEKSVFELLKSKALLVVDGFNQGLLVGIEGFEIRAIKQPETEQSVRGPKEGFIESISVNLSLLRRKIHHPDLRFDTTELGEYSNLGVIVSYVKDIADPELVKRVKDRIKQIKVDTIESSGEIEQMIEDHPYSIFSTIGNTERPDVAARFLLEGKIMILIDGDPTALFVPSMFVENFKNVEDYYSRPYYSSFIRLLRFFSFLVSISLPALFITALNFNTALIPSDIIVPLIQARESVPFPLAMEVIMMILMFEVVREAGVRLPQQIGTAISIVGPLILGDVAVTSGLVGAPTVVIVSISYIAAFLITPIADVTSLLRIYLFFASSIFGSFGLCMALLGLLTHMVSLSSLGVPYMAPFSPLHYKDWKDAIIRFPTKLMWKRSRSIPNRRDRKIWSLPETSGKK